MRNQTYFIIIGFTFMLLAANVAVADAQFDVRVGADYSDNIRRDEILQEEETSAFVGLKLQADHESRRLVANIVADLQHKEYLDDVFDNEDTGSAVVNVDLKIIPERFSWILEDNFGTLQRNQFQANTPGNRENINVFSTGPVFDFRFGSRSTLTLSGKYTDRYFEESQNGSDVISGQIMLARALSQNRSISFNVDTNNVEFDANVNGIDFDRRSAYVGFSSQNSRGNINLSVGANEIDDSTDTNTGVLLDVRWLRNLTTRSSITLGYDQRLSDVADTFRRFQTPGPSFGDTSSNPAVADPFENRRYSAVFQTERRGNRFNISAFRAEQDYENLNQLNRDRTGVSVGISSSFGSGWRSSLRAGFERAEFASSSREDDDLEFRATLSRQLYRSIRINLEYAYSKRDSSDPQFDYSENVGTLSISYAR